MRAKYRQHYRWYGSSVAEVPNHKRCLHEAREDRRPAVARRTFGDSVQAYTDVASIRGVGLSLIGLGATEAVEQRPGKAVQIAPAVEVYAHQEGIVNVYSDETPGREFVDQARAALSADDVARATEVGRRLTIKEALDLVGSSETASVEPAGRSASEDVLS